ncbi:MAG: bifunctional metallophosphatase/5'-nucleotidase, partial [Sphingobacterium sp.]
YNTDQVSDLIMAQNTKNIDLIIGGHTHTFLKTPTEVKNLDGKTTLVTQTGKSGINLGRIDFIFDKNKKIQNIQSYNYLLDASLDKIIV